MPETETARYLRPEKVIRRANFYLVKFSDILLM